MSLPDSVHVVAIEELYTAEVLTDVVLTPSASLVVSRTMTSQFLYVTTSHGTLSVYVAPFPTEGSPDVVLGYVYTAEKSIVFWSPDAFSPDFGVTVDGESVADKAIDGHQLSIDGRDAAGSVILIDDRELSDEAERLLGRVHRILTQSRLSVAQRDRLIQKMDFGPLEREPPSVSSSITLVPTNAGWLPDSAEFTACEEVPPSAGPEDRCPSDIAAVGGGTPTTSTAVRKAELAVSAVVPAPGPYTTIQDRIVMTRPVIKAFIPEPSVDAPGGYCEPLPIMMSTFEGDGRAPGPDQPRTRTTAYWNLRWDDNSAAYVELVHDTVVLRRLWGFFFQAGPFQIVLPSHVDETDFRDNAGGGFMSGSTGFWYSAGGTEGRSGVDLANDTPNVFCTAAAIMGISQHLDENVIGPATWERDGSVRAVLSHDQFPAHEAYTWYYHSDLGRLEPIDFYSWTPPSFIYGTCLFELPIRCPHVTHVWIVP